MQSDESFAPPHVTPFFLIEAFLSKVAPAAVLAVALSFLPCRDIVTVTTSLNKSITSSLRDEGAEHWACLVLRKLQGFLPARAFFDGPVNRSSMGVMGTPMRDLFSSTAVDCDKALTAAVLAVGPAAKGATWSWEGPTYVQMANGNNRNSSAIVNPAARITDAGATGMAEFRAWAQAFSCGVCDTAGSVQLQCAACATLLCRACSHRCDADREVGSPPMYFKTLMEKEGEGMLAERRESLEKLHAEQNGPPRCHAHWTLSVRPLQ